MLKSLYSGVSGLQSHQVAMDVESNNIANVNTVGFKYSRANFSDLLAQTKSIATSPQGSLGGQNPVQVGLGSTVNSMTRIFSQGSLQNSDKNTDVAISGDGFFVVSGDAGNTLNYTRAGDFKFDAGGNFVDNNGFITQGWLRDPITGDVNSSAPLSDINIAPGLTTPASPTAEITLKANLNSGPTITSSSPAYSSAEITAGATSGDLGVLYNSGGESFSMQDGQSITMTFTDIAGVATPATYTYDATGLVGAPSFKTMADLAAAMQVDAQIADPAATVTINNEGKFQIAADAGLDISVDSGDNEKFTTSMSALSVSLSAGTSAFSQDFNVATHSSSIDVFDSLGTKNTVITEFRKTASDQWAMKISVTEPAEISTGTPANEVDGFVKFNPDGSLLTYNPPSISFTANNGSTENQQINLSYGTPNSFTGLTSFDSPSATSNIGQDGYTGGDLVGIRIDQAGVLVGSFSNGRSFGLAQLAMAKFTNNEGLTTDGGNLYSQSANSGDPIIGSAATGGRGAIQSSALEASNVDLSRALTQLIIIQRGYQANGKTITTSDTLLETLIGLKR